MFVALLLRFGIERANPLLSGLVGWLTNGYEPSDLESAPLTTSEIMAISGLGQINLSRLSGNRILQDELANACLKFLTKGEVFLGSTQNADAVQIGFARVQTDNTDDDSHWSLGTVLEDQTRLRVSLDEPLVIAAALQYFEKDQLLSIDNLIIKQLRSNPEPAIRGFIMETVALMALLHAFNGVRSLSQIFQIQHASNEDYLLHPASIQAITGRGGDGIFQTIPVQFQKGSVPLLGFTARTPEGVTMWLNGSHIPFLFPLNTMGPDILFLIRAANKFVWICVQVKSRANNLTPKETSSAFKTVDPEYFWLDKVRLLQNLIP
jgi:hypothetical protein